MSREAPARFCVSVVVAALLLTGCNANQAILTIPPATRRTTLGMPVVAVAGEWCAHASTILRVACAWCRDHPLLALRALLRGVESWRGVTMAGDGRPPSFKWLTDFFPKTSRRSHPPQGHLRSTSGAHQGAQGRLKACIKGATGAAVSGEPLTGTAAPEAQPGTPQPERGYNGAGAGWVPSGPQEPSTSINVAAPPPAPA